MNAIRKILDDCGGIPAVAFYLGAHQVTVTGWETSGIPEKRWAEIMRLAPRKVTAARLHAANEEARKAHSSGAADA